MIAKSKLNATDKTFQDGIETYITLFVFKFFGIEALPAFLLDRSQAKVSSKKKIDKKHKVKTIIPNSKMKPVTRETRQVNDRFISPPIGFRFKDATITHPELKISCCLDILGVKKSPTCLRGSLEVIAKGTILEVNVSEMGLDQAAMWGKYAQVTNNPEIDGCINGVLLV